MRRQWWQAAAGRWMMWRRMTATLLVADDHPLFRAALRTAIGAAVPGVQFIEADSISQLFEALEQPGLPDLLLLDLNMPGAQGFSALAHLRGAWPQLPVVVVSALDDAATVRQCLRFGAQGFISKSADAAHIGSDVRAVLDGELAVPAHVERVAAAGSDEPQLAVAQRMAELTPAQFRVLGMLCAGRMNKQIAFDLQISEATVKAHMTAIMRKLGVATRTQAVLLAGQLALRPDDVHAPPEES
jgi:DNA-binding NarL/FixJ family response regulator